MIEKDKYFRAKLSDKDRLLFKSMKYGDIFFVIFEVILNHDYRKSKFLSSKENIKIVDQNNKEASNNVGEVEIRDATQTRWVGKFITYSGKQEKNS